MHYHWNWLFFFQETDDGLKYYHWILSGLGWTVAVSLAAFALALVLGSVFGVLRTTPHKGWVVMGDIFVDLFRNVPLIVQLFLWFFVLPELLPTRWGDWYKQSLPPFVTAVLGLALFTAARIAEQVKAGIQALPRGQRAAGLALGLTEWQTYRYVRLPMAYRIIIPTLTTEAMNIFKNSAVTYSVGILELYFQYAQIIDKTSQILEITIVMTVIYVILSLSVYALARFIERRAQVPGYIAGGQGGGR